jgi:hypothetical protein
MHGGKWHFRQGLMARMIQSGKLAERFRRMGSLVEKCVEASYAFLISGVGFWSADSLDLDHGLSIEI